MIVKVKIDDWTKKVLKSRLGFKMLGGQEMNPIDLIILSLIEKKKSGETVDLTEKAGKLKKLLDRHE